MTVQFAARFALAVGMIMVLSTCSGGPSGSSGAGRGWLSVRLTTPNLNDGGLMFTVEGGTIDSIRTTYPTIVSRRISGSSERVVIGGDLNNGDIAQILVPNVGLASRYRATPLEATMAVTFGQRVIAGYILTITGPN